MIDSIFLYKMWPITCKKKLDAKERHKYKLARAREKKSKNLGNIKCIKGEYNRVLVKDDKV